MSVISDKINNQLDKDVILFSNKEEYLLFIKNMATLFTPENNNIDSTHTRTYERTRFRCIEDIESFFDITFGDPDSDEYQDGKVNLSDIRTEFDDLQPKQFPCLLVTACLGCLRYGSHTVNYYDNPVYVYKSDFGE